MTSLAAVRPFAEAPLGWLRRWPTRPRFLALAAFLFAGDLKADPRLAWVPVDLTLLTGALLAGVLALRLAQGARLASWRVPLLLGVWFLTFLPGVWGFAPTDYGLQKVATIFTFTLLSALAPLVLVGGEGDVAPLMNAVACFCLAITLGGLLGGGGDHAAQRLQAFGAGTISLGRASGLLFTYAAVRLGWDPWPQPATFAVLCLAGVTALFSGSRGPILAGLAALALLGLAVLAAPGESRAQGRPWRAPAWLPKGLLAAGALLAVLYGSLSLAPEGSRRRLESFAQGQAGASEQYRVHALGAAWNLLREVPWGVGWGGFATQVDPEKGVPRQYPHNLLAEVTLEAGWPAGAGTVAVLLAATAAAWSRTALLGGRIALAGVLFYAFNGLVSGDFNDNRVLFMFLTLALVLGERPGPASGPSGCRP